MSFPPRQIRIPGELADRVQVLADEQRRSLSSMAAILLEDALRPRTVNAPVSPRTVPLPEREIRTDFK